MNREIRFNAWIPELNYMLDDVAVGHGSISFPFTDEPDDEFYQFLKSKGFITGEEDNLPEYIYDSGEDWCSITDPKHFVLLQFTGLKDINEKEMYEDDIIKYGDKTYRITYKDGCFWGISKSNTHWIKYLYDLTSGEVIGNINANPALL